MKPIEKPGVIPPWMVPDCFGSAPYLSDNPDTGYGFLKGKEVNQELSKGSLASWICGDSSRKIKLCWTPEKPYLVTPTEVPSLFDAVCRRMEVSIKQPFVLVVSKMSILLYGGLLIWGISDIIVNIGFKKFIADPEYVSAFQGIAFMLFIFGVMPFAQRWWGLRQLRKFTPEKMANEIPDSRYDVWLSQHTSFWTYALLACIGLVGLAQLFLGTENSIRAAGLVKDMVRAGEWWRLLTAPFLHASYWHIAMNALVLYSLGRIVEIAANKAYLLVVFAISALSGSLFSLVWLPDKTSVGASGGILGLLGFLVVFGYTHKRMFPTLYLKSLLINVVYIALIGVIGLGFIDNAAHLGGILAGAFLGFICTRGTQNVPIKPSLALNATTIVGSLIILFFTVISIAEIVLNK